MATIDITTQILNATTTTTIALTPADSHVLALPQGTTTFPGRFTGDGSITLRSPSAAGSVLVLADGTRFTLPSPGTTVVLTRSGGAWSVDYTNALMANKDIVLSGNVGAGVTIKGNSGTNYTGKVSGEGKLVIKSPDGFQAVLNLGANGPSFDLARGNYANNTTTAILRDGAWSQDVTTAILTGRNVTVTLPAVATLPAGASTMTGALSLRDGKPLAIVAADAPGGSTLTLSNGTKIVLGTPGQTATLSQVNGGLVIDRTSALLAGHDIVLAAKTVATLPAGTTDYRGTISGPGSLTLVAGAANSALRLPDGTLVKLTVPGQSVGVSQVNGIWTTDVSAALAANQDIVLTGSASATLPAGTLTYTGKISGIGNLTLTANNMAASTLQLADGTRFVLPGNGMTETAILGSGGWSVDVTQAILSGRPITLTVPAVANLPAGTVASATIVDGQGTLTVNGNATSPSTLHLTKNPAALMTLTAPGQSQTAALSNGIWTTDFGPAIAADQNIVLSGTASVALPAGETVYTGALTGSGLLMLSSGTAGASLTLPGGTLFTLPEAGQNAVARLFGGQWTLDVTQSVAAGQDIVLNSAITTVATLPAGVTDLQSMVSGDGRLVLTSSASGPSTLILKDGTRFVFPTAGTVVTATRSNGGWTLDVTAALNANKDIVLNGVPAVASLQGGTVNDARVVNYTGTISGEGTLSLSGSNARLNTPGKSWLLKSPQTVTGVLDDGAWTTDITAAFLANAQIALDGPSVLRLPAGITRFDGQITGSGTLRIVGSAKKGSTVDIRGQAVAMPGPGQELIATFSAGSFTVDYTPVVAAGVAIYLDAAGVIDLGPGVTQAGRFYDNGALTLRTGAAGGGTLLLGDGQRLVVPEANETILFRLSNGRWTMDATAAVAKGQSFVMTSETVATVAAGTTLVKASGSGSLTLIGATNAVSTVQIEGGPKLVIPANARLKTTLENGVWTTDFSDFIRGNRDIHLDGPAVLTFDAGNYLFHNAAITGTGTLTFANVGTRETIVTLRDGTQLALARGASSNQITVSFENGVLKGADITASVLDDDDVWLNMPTTIVLPAGVTAHSGNLFYKAPNGQPISLTIKGAPEGSTLLFRGTSVTIPAGGDAVRLSMASDGRLSADLTSNILAGTPIVLAAGIPGAVALPRGTTVYNAAIAGDGTLTLKTGPAGAGTLVLSDGTRFVLTAANETMTITKSGGAWTMDVSAAIAANQDIVLTGDTVATLPAGLVTYTGKITGAGTLAIKAANAGGGSTLKLADGSSHVLASGNQTETLIVANGMITTDISQAIAARQAAVLSGNAILRLPAGTHSAPAITGTGTLTITAADAPGGSTVQFSNGASFVLPAAGQTITATLSAGAWTSDVTAALLANQPITLTGNAVATLPAGITAYTSTINGTGTLTVGKTGASSTLVLADGTDFPLGAANPRQTITLDRGTVIVDIGAALVAGQAIALDGLATATLPAGTLNHNGALTGSGQVRLTAGASGGTLRLADGTTIALAAGGATTLVWGQAGDPPDLTDAMRANRNLVLHGPATISINGGTLNHIGALSGSGTIALANVATGSSARIVLGGSSSVTLPPDGQASATLSGGLWTLDATKLLDAGKTITLSMPTMVRLPAGVTDFPAGFAGSGTVTLVASSAGGSSLRLPGGAVIALPEAGESLTATLNGNTVTAIDASAAVNAGHDVALGAIPTVVTLPAGTTTYSGALIGTGTLKLTASSAGSKLVLADGATYSLPAAGQAVTLNVSPSGIVADVTAALLANQPLVLTGRSVAALPGGSRNYTGSIAGTGMLTLTSPPNSSSQLVIGTTRLTLPEGGSTLVASLSGGVWTADVTQMLLAGKAISLDVPATAALPEGVTRFAGAIQQAGALKLTSATGNSTLVLPDGASIVLTAPGASATVSFNSGQISIDATQMLAARQPIVLNARTTATTPGGTTDLTGLITGDGAITLKATAPATVILGPNDRVTVPAGGAVKISRIGGVWAEDVTPAFQAGQPIVLDGPATLDLAAGTNRFVGTLGGAGALVVTSSAGNSTLVLPDGATFTLAAGSQTQTLKQVAGAWVADVTQPLLASQNITLTGPSVATIPGGVTRFNGALGGYSPLTVTSSSPDAVLSLRNNRSFVLGGGEATIRSYDNQWALDVSTALAGGKPIVMNGLTVATLPAGVTRYAGTLSGTGTLVLVAPKTSAATLVLPGGASVTAAANTTQSVTLVGGSIATDVTAAIAANQSIALDGPAVVQLAGGTTTHAGAISGTGTLVLKTGKSGGTLKLADGATFTLPAGNETISAARSGGVWTLDVSNAVIANQPVTLTGNAVATLPAGTTIYTGALAGDGVFTLVSPSGASRLQMPDGSVHVLGAAGQRAVVTVSGGKVVSTDVTSAILADHDVTVTGAMTATLGVGVDRYTGALSGSGTLTFKSGAGGGGTLVLADGTRFVLSGANETVKATLANGAWTADYSAALAGNFAIELGVPATATLAAGVTRLTRPITGTGALKLTSAASGGSTLVLADGTRFVLPAANETATATFRNGAWTLDVTAALLANQDIELTGAAVALLPGNVVYSGKITGTGTLALSSPSGRDAALTLSASSTVFRLPSAGQTQTASLLGGVWSVDVTAAMLANHNVALTVPAVFNLPAGSVAYAGSFSGNGSLTLVSRTGGSTLTLNGVAYTLGSVGETVTVTYTNGVPVTDVTAALKANHAIELNGASTATLAGGTTSYTGAMAGDGTLKVTSAAAGAVLKLPNGGSVTLPDAGTTVTLTVRNGVWTTDVSAALAANKAIVLSGQAVATLPAGSFTYTGTIGGAGTLKLVSANVATGSTLAIPGKTFILPAGNETYLATLSGGVWSLDVTPAILANQAVTLNGPATVTLPAGATIYRGAIGGSGTLILKSGPEGGTLQAGANRFLLAPDTTAVATLANGAWSLDHSASVAGGKDIALAGPTVVTLASGVTRYAGKITGGGQLTLKAAAGGPSTLVLADGTTFTLATAGQVQTVTFGGATLTTDVTAALAGNQPLVLSGAMTAVLPAGTLTRTAAITGTGTLTISSGPNGGGALTLADGTRFTLPAANQSVVATKTASGWTTDISSIIASGRPIVIDGATTVTLPAGTTRLTAPLSGTGVLTLTASRSGASTLVLADGTTYMLPADGVGTLRLSNGAPVFDITAAILANQAITLTGQAIVKLPAGVTTYTGTIAGAGSIVFTSDSGAPSTLNLKGGQSFVLTSGQTVTGLLAGGAWTTDVTAAILANQNVTIDGDAVFTAPVGTRTYTGAIAGNGTLTVTGPASGAATVNGLPGASYALGSGIAQEVVEISAGRGAVDLGQAVAANRAIMLKGSGFVSLAAGTTTYTGAVTGAGTLTLLGAATADSVIALPGGQSFTVPRNGVIALQNTPSGWVESKTVDITAALRAGRQSIVFADKDYVVDIPEGETIRYNGIMSGTGTLRIKGGGSLILTNTSTFTLPKDQITQEIVQVRGRPMDFHGLPIGAYGGQMYVVRGEDPPAVIVEKGATLRLGDPSQNLGVGAIANHASGFGVTYNLNNFHVEGTLDINYYGGAGYFYPMGKISGDGVLTNNNGSVLSGGDSSFSGQAHFSGFNFGSSHAQGSMNNVEAISNGFVLTFSGLPATTNGGKNGEATDGYTYIRNDIYENHYGNSIHNLGPGVLVFTGVYHYTDSGDQLNPSLSNPLLDYMVLNGNASHRRFFSPGFRQFGDGTDAEFFMPGNEITTYFDAGGTTAFNYNGTVRMNGSYGRPGDGGNVIIVGTEGNRVIFTQPTHYNGITLIGKNAVLQLGDGTLGNGETITTAAAYGNVTGWYSTSGGNGSIETAQSASGSPTNEIRLEGELVLSNTVGARSGVGQETLSNVTGTGDLTQQGNQTVTLLHNTTYTGQTAISNGTLALGLYGDISTSSGVILKNAAAMFDISQAGDSKLKSIQAVAGSTIALGAHDLTILSGGVSRIAGSLVDGGLGGGSGGGLVMAGSGVLELAGAQGYTGQTMVAAGTLRLDGASLASRSVSVATGARLVGSGVLTGDVVNDGVIRAEGGRLTIAGDVTGTGTIVIGNGSVLTLSGATSQTIVFEGNGILRLTDPDAFAGTLVGFDATSAIELAGVAAPSLSFSEATDIVTVADNGKVLTQLKVDEAFSTGGFTVTQDGLGGSRIKPATAPEPVLTVNLSGDRWMGEDAKAAISVNGVRQPGIYTITASHAAKELQAIAIPGFFGTGPVRIDVAFLNNADDGPSKTGRNLYIDSVTYYGRVNPINIAIITARSRALTVSPPAREYTIGATDTLTLRLSEDAWRGDAKFRVSVDGVAIGDIQTVTALRGQGQSQDFSFTGSFGAGPHRIEVNFLNDAYGGTATTDRNLYVEQITLNGQTKVLNAVQKSAGPRTYADFGADIVKVADADATVSASGNDTIHAGDGDATILATGPSAKIIGGAGDTQVIGGVGRLDIVANDADMTVTAGTGAMTFLGGSGHAQIAAGSGAATVTAGSGGLEFTAGSGAAVLTAGSGVDIFSFLKDSAGGTALLKDFTPGIDAIRLVNYGAASLDQSLSQAYVASGNLIVELSDHTKLQFAGVSTIDRSSFQIV